MATDSHVLFALGALVLLAAPASGAGSAATGAAWADPFAVPSESVAIALCSEPPVSSAEARPAGPGPFEWDSAPEAASRLGPGPTPGKVRRFRVDRRPPEFWWPRPAQVLASVFGPCGARACCRYCVVGKACGDNCISRAKTCRVGCGCACDRPDPFPD